MSKSLLLHKCPDCGEHYWTGIKSNPIKHGGLKCNECGTHFGVDAAEKIIEFDDPMNTHDCPEEGEQINKIRAVAINPDTGTQECSYCGQEIESVKTFDSLEEYREHESR